MPLDVMERLASRCTKHAAYVGLILDIIQVIESECIQWAVVVAKLVEWSLLTTNICGLNFNTGKILSTNFAIK